MPISRHVVVTLRPRITDITTAGAEITTLHDRLRENRNSSAVNVRIFESKRVLEVLVGGEDVGAVEERHQRHRQDDHRDRQRVVVLQEAHAVDVGLAGRADHRDRRQLRRHHRQADEPPRQAAAGEEIALELFRALVMRRPSQTTQTRYATTTASRRVRMSAGEVRLERVERGERHHPDDHDADVLAGHAGSFRLVTHERRHAFAEGSLGGRESLAAQLPGRLDRSPGWRARLADRPRRFATAPDRRRSCGPRRSAAGS